MRRRVDHGRRQALVELEREIEIRPPDERRTPAVDVHVVESTGAELRPGPQVLIRRHQPHLAGGDEIPVDHEHLVGVEADGHVTGLRSREPRMPSEAGRPCSRVPADRKLQIEMRLREPQRLVRLSAEGPTQTAKLARHAGRGLALRHDMPRFVEHETVDR